jgi:hypothetical protein
VGRRRLFIFCGNSSSKLVEEKTAVAGSVVDAVDDSVEQVVGSIERTWPAANQSSLVNQIHSLFGFFEPLFHVINVSKMHIRDRESSSSQLDLWRFSQGSDC